MKEVDQRVIAFHFHELAERIQLLYEEAGRIADTYPRIRQEDMYLNLRGFLHDAVEESEGLQDYIIHASNEDWSVERQ